MNKDIFLHQIEQNVKNVLCVDFDGVLHNDHLGFYDGSIYGEPIQGSLESIKNLSKRYKIVIFTCKANPDRPLVNDKTGIELIWEWLDKYGFKDFITDITFYKPQAKAYIDDKAIKFENWADTILLVDKI